MDNNRFDVYHRKPLLTNYDEIAKAGGSQVTPGIIGWPDSYELWGQVAYILPKGVCLGKEGVRHIAQSPPKKSIPVPTRFPSAHNAIPAIKTLTSSKKGGCTITPQATPTITGTSPNMSVNLPYS